MASARGRLSSSSSRAEMKESACADGSPPSLSSPCAGIGEHLVRECDAALRLGLQEMEALGRGIWIMPITSSPRIAMLRWSFQRRRLIGAR